MAVKITLTDSQTLNPGDLDFSTLMALGNVTSYPRTSASEKVSRLKDTEIAVVNKTLLDRETIDQLPNLRCICVTATGYNNVDTAAAKERNIPVCNVTGYSTNSVAQHVFAMMGAVQNRIEEHHKSVQNDTWANCPDFSYTLSTVSEFAGKTMGIYGFGRIGQQVAKIAAAYGMRVISKHKHPERDAGKGAEFVEWETLLEQSDYLSLHAPLTTQNEGIINAESLKKMKPSAILINTGRGGLINEEDLRKALGEGVITAACLDVLSSEPPPKAHPLIGLDNCLITPHIAWASKEARETLLAETIENIKAFMNGQARNVVNG